MKQLILCCCLLMAGFTALAFTRQDTLRGSNGPGRSWWDVQHYDLHITIDTARRSIQGVNLITLNVSSVPHDSLQIDLQDGMFLDEVIWQSKQLDFVKDGNVFWITHPFKEWPAGSSQLLKLKYHGRPREATNPPWNGGFIWAKDSLGNPWLSVACQGLGAGSWWPCKDYQGDEPDQGMRFSITPLPPYQIISNGRFAADDTTVAGVPGQVIRMDAGSWKTSNPINTYDVAFYIGDYAHWQDTIMGEKGKLDLDYFPLKYNEARARTQFPVAKKMLHCFEYWMGPYPFYEDGYKLVEAPFLGMEHQSAVAYGNEYKTGYRGRERSGTGIGLLFDAIIVHESGHEWFGNSITAQDIADNWIHEGFTTYSEVLFVQSRWGRDTAFRFARGLWHNIRNDVPVTGHYGVSDEGSSDKYDKGAAVIHMIRVMINDDEKFRQLLRGLNRDFYHKTVTSAAVETYIMKFTGLELKAFFKQYLRSVEIPVLEYQAGRKKLKFRFTHTAPGFTLPLSITADRKQITINPTDQWQEISWKHHKDVSFSPDFLYSQQYVMD